MIKDLSDNHLFNNYPCEAEDVKIEALRERVALMQKQISADVAQILKLRDVLQFYMDNGICEPLYHKALKALAETEPKP